MTPAQIDRLEELRQRRAADEEDRVRELAEQAELEALEREAEAEASRERDRRQEAARQAERDRLRHWSEPHESGAVIRHHFRPDGRLDARHPFRACCPCGVTIETGATREHAIGELVGYLESTPEVAAALAAEADETETDQEEQSNAA